MKSHTLYLQPTTYLTMLQGSHGRYYHHFTILQKRKLRHRVKWGTEVILYYHRKIIQCLSLIFLLTYTKIIIELLLGNSTHLNSPKIFLKEIKSEFKQLVFNTSNQLPTNGPWQIKKCYFYGLQVYFLKSKLNSSRK